MKFSTVICFVSVNSRHELKDESMNRQETPDHGPPSYTDALRLPPSASIPSLSAPPHPLLEPQRFPPPAASQSLPPAGESATPYPPHGAELLPQQPVHQHEPQQVMYLLLVRLMGQYCFACWRLLSMVICNAAGAWAVGRRQAGCMGGQHCTAGQYGYVPFWWHLVYYIVYYIVTQAHKSP